MRFNPNLYANLLGTWRGGVSGSENWTFKSTLRCCWCWSLRQRVRPMNELGVEASFGSADAMLQAHISAKGGVALGYTTPLF